MDRNRQIVLGGLLLTLGALTAYVLAAVLHTVVFAITVAYVLYPIKRWLSRRGVTDRLASGVATVTAFLVVALVVIPLLLVGYQRREQFVEVLQTVPETISIAFAGAEFELETDPVVDGAIDSVRDVAVELAVATPGFALHLALFTILLYGLLYKPRAVRAAVFAAVPTAYHDVVSRLHTRASTTLFSLYVLQAVTALSTFLIALALFWILGYSATLTLALIAGILQFVPIVGPSILVIALGVNDILIGNPARAVGIFVFGLFFVAFLPDAVIRTKLAGYTGTISSTMYFVGFVGGILTIGAIGIIVGPLVVALLVEAVELLSERVPEETDVTDPSPDGSAQVPADQ